MNKEMEEGRKEDERRNILRHFTASELEGLKGGRKEGREREREEERQLRER